jgi:hypothetical protein
MPRKSAEQASSSRLETQIHRRKKARPFSPLLPEWETHDQTAPLHLRMDAARMAAPPARPKPDQGRTSGSPV